MYRFISVISRVIKYNCNDLRTLTIVIGITKEGGGLKHFKFYFSTLDPIKKKKKRTTNNLKNNRFNPIDFVLIRLFFFFKNQNDINHFVVVMNAASHTRFQIVYNLSVLKKTAVVTIEYIVF